MLLECPKCGRQLLVKGDLNSGRVKCGNCGEVFDVAEVGAKETRNVADDSPEPARTPSSRSSPGTAALGPDSTFLYRDTGYTGATYARSGTKSLAIGTLLFLIGAVITYFGVRAALRPHLLGVYVLILAIACLISATVYIVDGARAFTKGSTAVRANLKCCHCGNQRHVIPFDGPRIGQPVRCTNCASLLWPPRAPGETVQLVTCPLCRASNGLPVGSSQAVRCPNCDTAIAASQKGTATLAEETAECPRCQAALGHFTWFCPECRVVVNPAKVTQIQLNDGENISLRARAFLDGLAPNGALAAAIVLEYSVYRELVAKTPSSHWSTAQLHRHLRDFDRLVLAAYCLVRARKDIGASKLVKKSLQIVDVLYAMLLVRAFHNLSSSTSTKTQADREVARIESESAVALLRTQVTSYATYRAFAGSKSEMPPALDLRQFERIARASRWWVEIPENAFGSGTGGEVRSQLVVLLGTAGRVLRVSQDESGQIADESLILSRLQGRFDAICPHIQRWFESAIVLRHS